MYIHTYVYAWKMVRREEQRETMTETGERPIYEVREGKRINGKRW